MFLKCSRVVSKLTPKASAVILHRFPDVAIEASSCESVSRYYTTCVQFSIASLKTVTFFAHRFCAACWTLVSPHLCWIFRIGPRSADDAGFRRLHDQTG
jgi:hypothetical protein